jgi:hypothetical protein
VELDDYMLAPPLPPDSEDRQGLLRERVVADMAEAIRAAVDRAATAILESPDNKWSQERTRDLMPILMLKAARDVSVSIGDAEMTRGWLYILATDHDARPRMPPPSAKSAEAKRRLRQRQKAARKASRRS